MDIVRLTPFEVMHAAMVGVSRRVSALRDGRQVEAGRTDQVWERDIIGAIGEYAVSRFIDVSWAPMIGRLDTERGDVGGYQVRATSRRDGCLIVKPLDSEDDWFALAIVAGLDVLLPGRAHGSAAKVPRHWRDVGGGVHQAAHFVPQSALEPLVALAA